jgi:GNAT superfamily N-acetyltransferase
MRRCGIPSISAVADSEASTEDQTLLTLYALAGETNGGTVTFRFSLFREISRTLFTHNAPQAGHLIIDSVEVRELTPAEMTRAEREVWIHYHQQKADPEHDRLFAVFAGSRLIGVARCARHPDGLEVDAVYVLDEYRRRGFARSVMQLLIEECGRTETLFMHSKTELVEFYGGLGFYPIKEAELPKTIRERFDFCLGELKGIDVCPMKRDPAPAPAEVTA